MCKRCDKRGKPSHFGSDPRCAFPTGAFFTSNNWQCATVNLLRVQMEDNGYVTRQNDESIGVLKIPDAVGNGYLVMTWYKNRGSTGGALVLDDDEPPQVLTLEIAEKLLSEYMGTLD